MRECQKAIYSNKSIVSAFFFGVWALKRQMCSALLWMVSASRVCMCWKQMKYHSNSSFSFHIICTHLNFGRNKRERAQIFGANNVVRHMIGIYETVYCTALGLKCITTVKFFCWNKKLLRFISYAKHKRRIIDLRPFTRRIHTYLWECVCVCVHETEPHDTCYMHIDDWPHL